MFGILFLSAMDKKSLSERDICTKFITPALEKAGWNKLTQFLEEVSFTDEKTCVRGKMTARGERKRADYVLYYKPNIPIAIIDAKDNKHTVRAGMQQALNYARILGVPRVFSSNGDGFLFHSITSLRRNSFGRSIKSTKASPYPTRRKSPRNCITPTAADAIHAIISKLRSIDILLVTISPPGRGRAPI